MTPQWQYKKEFHLVGELRKILAVAKEAAEKERDALRRKLDKTTYGS